MLMKNEILKERSDKLCSERKIRLSIFKRMEDLLDSYVKFYKNLTGLRKELKDSDERINVILNCKKGKRL